MSRTTRRAVLLGLAAGSAGARAREWVQNSWIGNPNYLPSGPIGLAYRIIGTPPFALSSLLYP